MRVATDVNSSTLTAGSVVCERTGICDFHTTHAPGRIKESVNWLSGERKVKCILAAESPRTTVANNA